MQQTFHIKDLIEYGNANPDIKVSNNDYLLLRLDTPIGDFPKLPRAFKIDGVSIFMCVRGESKILVDFVPVTLRSGMLLVLNPATLIEIEDSETMSSDSYALFLSRDFLNMMSLDSSALDYTKRAFTSAPTVKLSGDLERLLSGYFRLLRLNATTNVESNVYTRNISRSLISALIYQIMSMRETQEADESSESGSLRRSGRRGHYVKDFMSLVSKNFRSERSVGFYAERLFISAKYLSLIIKESTGYTATEWIDHYVILEAKNLLRFSGRNIQQIAYDLNFHNQSSFGKYFKHLTGMSPSEFRKS